MSSTFLEGTDSAVPQQLLFALPRAFCTVCQTAKTISKIPAAIMILSIFKTFPVSCKTRPGVLHDEKNSDNQQERQFSASPAYISYLQFFEALKSPEVLCFLPYFWQDPAFGQPIQTVPRFFSRIIYRIARETTSTRTTIEIKVARFTVILSFQRFYK